MVINETQEHNNTSVNQNDDEEEYQEEPSESDLDSIGGSVAENNGFIATESEEDIQPKRRGRPRRSYQKTEKS